MYWNLLFLFGILSQGVVGTFIEGNKESADILVREKRIIHPVGENLPVIIEDVPYVVQIIINGVMMCTGSLISHDIVITCAHCVHGLDLSSFHVLSDSIYIYKRTRHNVIRKKEHHLYNPSRYYDDLALLLIFPPIDVIHSSNRPIELYAGPFPANKHGIVSSWGCIRVSTNKQDYPSKLRSVEIPIISLEECRNFYQGRKFITSKNICTLDNIGGKRCTFGDSGAPLVVGGKLVGVHAWNLKNEEFINPDVYIRIFDDEYRHWIMSNIASRLQ